MDLSIYYENFELTYNIANFAVLLAFLATVFLCIRRICDKSEYCNRVWKKLLLCFIYVLFFSVILTYYFTGPYLGKKDIDQKTIYSYEGEFEIIEVTDGIYNKAVFLVEGKEMCLKYSENDDYEIDMIKAGKYKGKLVYAQHAAQVLYIEIYKSK